MLVNSGRRFDLGHLAHRAGCGKHRDRCLHPRRQRAKIRTGLDRSSRRSAGPRRFRLLDVRFRSVRPQAAKRLIVEQHAKLDLDSRS
ncbi:MAG: hypothetical protein ABI407_15405 [Bradyrhizobium sp.]